MTFDSVHASVLLVGETGILVRGASGAGKSSLVLALLDACDGPGSRALLVADDRVSLVCVGGRLVARPHSRIAGQIEARTVGILRLEHEKSAVIRLVVDLVEGNPPRLPDVSERMVTLHGIALPCLRVMSGMQPCTAARQVRIKLRLESNS